VNIVELFQRGCAEFARPLGAVRDDAWTLPTPCPDWDVRALVDHVAGGNVQAAALLGDGAEPAPAGDPRTAWRHSADLAADRLSRPGAMEAPVHHPLGDITGAQLAFFRFDDHLVHAWDLATAVGADPELDPVLVAACLQFAEPLAGTLAASGQFAPAPPVPPDATPQTRLLALHGRRG
jgi:uncharacterized protein (TIGR03086 family)